MDEFIYRIVLFRFFFWIIVLDIFSLIYYRYFYILVFIVVLVIILSRGINLGFYK